MDRQIVSLNAELRTSLLLTGEFRRHRFTSLKKIATTLSWMNGSYKSSDSLWRVLGITYWKHETFPRNGKTGNLKIKFPIKTTFIFSLFLGKLSWNLLNDVVFNVGTYIRYLSLITIQYRNYISETPTNIIIHSNLTQTFCAFP